MSCVLCVALKVSPAKCPGWVARWCVAETVWLAEVPDWCKRGSKVRASLVKILGQLLVIESRLSMPVSRIDQGKQDERAPKSSHMKGTPPGLKGIILSEAT